MRISSILTAALLCCAASFSSAATATYDQSLVVVVAEAAPDTSFSAVNGNLPKIDRVAVDFDTSDYSPPLGPRGIADALLRFDDLVLPTRPVVSATLNFFTKSSTFGPIGIFQLFEGFDISTTWNSLGDGLTFGDQIFFAPDAEQFAIADEAPVSFDVTGILQNWAAGDDVFGFAILAGTDDGWDFQVVADGSAFAPFLTVTTVPLPTSALLLGSGALALLGLRRR